MPCARVRRLRGEGGSPGQREAPAEGKMQRMKVVLGHLSGGQPRASPCSSGFSGSFRSAAVGNPEDVVVVHGRRTPIGKSKRGGLKDTTPDELLSVVMTAVLKDLNLNPEKLGDICVGNVLQPGAGAAVARIAQFLSGIPETVPLSSVNRQCSSGLQAVVNIAGGIRNGSYDIGLACGVESMSLRSNELGDVSSRLADNSKARDCLIPMGYCSFCARWKCSTFVQLLFLA